MKTIAASPTFGGRNGLSAFRVVLRYREYDGAYVTHKQFLYDDGSTSFGDGNYFTWPHGMVLPNTTPFERAYADWLKRCEQENYVSLAPIERWAVIHEEQSS